MLNSRTRSTPDLGRGSSRYLRWIWYQIWGRSRYDASSSSTSRWAALWCVVEVTAHVYPTGPAPRLPAMSTPDPIRPALLEVLARRALTEDAARPEAVERLHARGGRTAREQVAALVDPGSFVEYGRFVTAAQEDKRSMDDLLDRTVADGIVGGLATIGGRSVAVLSYDYRSFDESTAAARSYMTPAYQEEYDKLVAALEPNLEEVQPVVQVEVVDSAVVRTGDDRVDVLVFVNRPTLRKGMDEPEIYKDQVTLRMVREDGRWLVGALSTNQLQE